MKNYTHITAYERDLISAGFEKRVSLREIGRRLGRDHTTISREIARNKLGAPRPSLVIQPYLPSKAHKKAVRRGIAQREKAPLKEPLTFVYVREHLRKPYRWSPETISGRVPIDHPGYSIDEETIYRYIYGKGKKFKLWKHLVCHRKKRMKKHGRKVHQYARLSFAIPIENRPTSINGRTRIGDWESDNMEGKRSDKTAVSVTVDRTARTVRLDKLKDHTADTKAYVLNKQFKNDTAYSITVDRGSENSSYQKIEKQSGVYTYACNPYHSWEKGTVENSIGRLRRVIPKGVSVDPITQKQLNLIEKWMNDTPRKCLGYLTPNEVYEKMRASS